MIIIELENDQPYYAYPIGTGWIIVSSKDSNTYYAVKPDGSYTKHVNIDLGNILYFNTFLDENGEETQDASKKCIIHRINQGYNCEFIIRDSTISRHLGFKEGEFGVVFENLKEKITKAFLIPDGILSLMSSRVFCFSLDGQTILIFGKKEKKLLILDNPVYQ